VDLLIIQNEIQLFNTDFNVSHSNQRPLRFRRIFNFRFRQGKVRLDFQFDVSLGTIFSGSGKAKFALTSRSEPPSVHLTSERVAAFLSAVGLALNDFCCDNCYHTHVSYDTYHGCHSAGKQPPTAASWSTECCGCVRNG
jgi:hypothetical protein